MRIMAIDDEKLVKKLVKYKIAENKNILYKEAILDTIKKYKNIEEIIISEKIPGEIDFIKLIKKIKQINKKIKIIIILYNKDIEKELLKININNIFYHNIFGIYKLIKKFKLNEKNKKFIHIKNKIFSIFQKINIYLKYKNKNILNKKEKIICIIGENKINTQIIKSIIIKKLIIKNKKIIIMNLNIKNKKMINKKILNKIEINNERRKNKIKNEKINNKIKSIKNKNLINKNIINKKNKNKIKNNSINKINNNFITNRKIIKINNCPQKYFLKIENNYNIYEKIINKNIKEVKNISKILKNKNILIKNKILKDTIKKYKNMNYYVILDIYGNNRNKLINTCESPIIKRYLNLIILENKEKNMVDLINLKNKKVNIIIINNNKNNLSKYFYKFILKNNFKNIKIINFEKLINI